MNKKGFTLIEIAMVLVVIGILLGIGTGMMGMLTKRTKLIESREVVRSAKEALSGYAVKYGYLPDTDIGLSGVRTLDAWGRSLLYARPASLGGACTGTCTGSVCSTGIGSCGICGLTSTDRTIYECTNATCSTSNTKPNIAFIVYSTGEDADGLGTTTKPTAAPACPAGTCYWIREQATSDASYTLEYDDIVQYVTLDEIRDARSCAFNITTQTLPDAKTGTAYNVTGVQLQASGGQTPYTSWTTGELQGACAAGSVRLVASDIGLCLDTSGVNAGLISGTPTTAGVHNFTVTLTDANAVTTSKTFTLNVIETLEIVTVSLPDAKTRVPYITTLGGRGGVSPYAWSVSGQALNTLGCPVNTYPIAADFCYNGTGVVGGTCTGTCIGGVCANGNGGTCTGTCTTPNTYGIVGNDTSAGFCITSTGVNAGVLSSTMTNATYTLLPGTYSFTVILTDANLKTASKVFVLNVVDYCSTGFTGGGVGIYSAAVRSYRKNNAATCNPWTAATFIYALPTDKAFLFFSNAACGTATCGTSPTAPINYATFINPLVTTMDTNANCSITWSTAAATCVYADR